MRLRCAVCGCSVSSHFKLEQEAGRPRNMLIVQPCKRCLTAALPQKSLNFLIVLDCFKMLVIGSLEPQQDDGD